MENTPNNESLERRLAQLEVPETLYRADMELHDRSQQFSSELLKLALAGIAVVGFLLANCPKMGLTKVFDDFLLKLLVSASVVAFAVSVIFALLHRFYASGGNFHHLQVIKLLRLRDPALDGEVEENMRIRTAKFLQCHLFLKVAAGLLVGAAIILAGAFVRFMFSGA